MKRKIKQLLVDINIASTWRQRREKKGISLSLVASKAGIDKSQLSCYERQKFIPKTKTVKKVEGVLRRLGA